MGAVLQYVNGSGQTTKRVWPEGNNGEFNALVKFYIQHENKLQTIEKPSKRPTTLEECKMVAKVSIDKYGSDLKQLVIWNLDEIKQRYSDWCKEE